MAAELELGTVQLKSGGKFQILEYLCSRDVVFAD
jgi:hypothetical protein